VLRRTFESKREKVPEGQEKCIFTKYFWDDKIKDGELGRALLKIFWSKGPCHSL
jgi:hypothetical protein